MEKTQFRHVKTGKVIWATAQWIKLTQEMREMHLWEKMDGQAIEAKLKFDVPGVLPAMEPAHEVLDVEMPQMDEPQTEMEQTPSAVEFQDVVEEPVEEIEPKAKKSKSNK